MHCETNRASTINLREEREKKEGVTGSVEKIGCDFVVVLSAVFTLHDTDWLKGLAVGGAEGKGWN